MILSKLSIRFKLIFLSASLAAIFLGSSFGYALFSVHEELSDSIINNFENKIIFKKNYIEVVLGEVLNTLEVTRNTPPIQGMIRADKNDGFDELGVSTYEQWRERLSVIFKAEIESQGVYEQLRYIDENGKEIVRVNFVNGVGYRVSDEDLQDKSDRDYFVEAIDWEDFDELYVSKIELNREGTPPKIVEPAKPVIRFALPVVDETTGDKRGLIVANVLFKNIIPAKIEGGEIESEGIIVDSDGYYLDSLDESKEWGGPHDFNTGENVFKDFPSISTDLKSKFEDTLEIDDKIFSFVKVSYNPQQSDSFITIIEHLSRDSLFKNVDAIFRNSALIGFATFAVLFFAFLYTVRHILSPLNSLADSAAKIGKGDFTVRVPIHADDEIGRLGRIFNNTAELLGRSYGQLESKVKEKTKELSVALSKQEKQNKSLENGKKAMLNLLEDLEQEKSRAENLVIDLNKFKLALDSTSDHVIITDSDGIILYANNGFERVTGWSKEEAIGRKAGDHLWGRQMPDEFYKKMWHRIKVEKKPFIGEMTNKHKDGTLYQAYANISPILDEKGEVKFFVGIERDITREKQIDKAKTEFVSLASHQLRTPLSTINWYAEMLIAGDAGKLTKEQYKYIEEIYKGNQRMVDLVNALLNVSRLELGTFVVEPELVDIVELANVVVNELTPQIKNKKINLSLKLQKNIPKVMADKKLLYIVFQNLLSNAVKYTKDGGKVEFSISNKNPKKDIKICVSDNGVGIPLSQQDKIFTKLFRADNVKESDTQGTGLGLYIIKSIIDHSSGKVWFESQENKGTKFYVTLPAKGMKKKAGKKKLS